MEYMKTYVGYHGIFWNIDIQMISSDLDMMGFHDVYFQ